MTTWTFGEELGDFPLFWCSGIWNAKAHIWNCVILLHLDNTPDCMQPCWKMGERRNLEKFFFPQLYIPSANHSWLVVFMTQMSPKQGPTGWKRKQSEGGCFFPEVTPTLSFRWVRSGHTACHGELVFLKNLREEFICIPQTNLRTCPLSVLSEELTAKNKPKPLRWFFLVRVLP